MAKQAKVLTGSVSASMSNYSSPVYTCCDYYGNSYIWYYQSAWYAQQTSTIYTVPSGRTAKVEIFHYTPYRSSSSSSYGTFHIGSTDVLASFNSIGWSGSLPLQWGNTGSTAYSNPNVLFIGGSYAIPKTVYLNAGETIRLVGPSSGNSGSASLAYGFSIVEEY